MPSMWTLLYLAGTWTCLLPAPQQSLIQQALDEPATIELEDVKLIDVFKEVTLQTGVVDGAEAANTNYNSKKFYEVAPHWATVAWTALVADLIMSEQKFQSLPKDVQAVLLEAGLGSAALERKTYSNSDNSLLETLKANGVTVTNPDTAPFRKASEKVYVEFVKTPEQKALLKQILETQ